LRRHKLACVATATAGEITDGDRGHVPRSLTQNRLCTVSSRSMATGGMQSHHGECREAHYSRFRIAIEAFIGVA
jgi:hypothetical protein